MKRTILLLIVAVLYIGSMSAKKSSSTLSQLCDYCATIEGAEKISLRHGLLRLATGNNDVKHIDVIECGNISKEQMAQIANFTEALDEEANILSVHEADDESDDYVYIYQEKNDVIIGVVSYESGNDLSVVKMTISRKLFDKYVSDNDGNISAKSLKKLTN